MNDSLLISAFFDNANLLAVRFSQNRNYSRVAHYSQMRRADSAVGGVRSIGPTILAGVAVVGLGLVFVTTCSGPGHTTTMVTSAVATDSQNSTSWLTGMATLGDALAPREGLRPWYVRTLLDVPRDQARHGQSLTDWLKPRHSTDDQTAYQQGAGLAHMLFSSGALDGTAVILDLPGPHAIAAAAGMADHFEPVFTMDNLPHPNGVVHSGDTLGAAVYWRGELVHAAAARSPTAPPVFLLEGDRLAPYANQPDVFDNRSHARLPDLAGFKSLGVTRILYVRQRRGDVAEADDLNALFTSCAANGIEVRHLALDSITQVAQNTDQAQTPLTPNTSPLPPPAYGGGSHDPAQVWFWNNYGWGRPLGSSWSGYSDPDAAYRARYRPPTTFGNEGISAFDGGMSRSTAVYSPPRAYSSYSSSSSGSSGSGHFGSWGRGFGSFSG